MLQQYDAVVEKKIVYYDDNHVMMMDVVDDLDF